MNEELIKDFEDLRSRKRAGHMGRWEYSYPLQDHDKVGGISLWAEFLKTHPEYYLALAEKRIASKAATHLTRYIDEPLSLIGLGTGDKEHFKAKELSLVSKFSRVAEIISLDKEGRYVMSSLEAAREARPEATLRGKCLDFFKNFSVSPSYIPFAAMFGGTLFNEEGFVQDGPPVEVTTRRLKIIRDGIKRGHFFITVDTNQDKDKIEKAYMGQAAFARNLVHLINRDTPYSFDYDQSRFRVEWHPKSHLLAHYLTLDGEEFHFNNSYKLPQEIFLNCAEQAEFKPIYSINVNGIVGYLMQTA